MKRNEKINIISGLYCFVSLIIYFSGIGGKGSHALALAIPLFCLTTIILIKNRKHIERYEIYLRKIKEITLKINPLLYFGSLFSLFFLFG